MVYFSYQLMKEKDNKFKAIVQSAISNIDEWNKKVKDKKYKIYESDSDSQKEITIYRYMNENDVG